MPIHRIRFHPGGEILEVKGRFWLLGFRQDDVGPGATYSMRTLPQSPCRPLGLLVDDTTGDDFELCDLRIGKNSQFLGQTPIPLAPFVGSVEGYPEMGVIAFTDKRFASVLDLDPCHAGCELTMDVRNHSGGMASFRGALSCFSPP